VREKSDSARLFPIPFATDQKGSLATTTQAEKQRKIPARWNRLISQDGTIFSVATADFSSCKFCANTATFGRFCGKYPYYFSFAENGAEKGQPDGQTILQIGPKSVSDRVCYMKSLLRDPGQGLASYVRQNISVRSTW
jgi:hypothetical protein